MGSEPGPVSIAGGEVRVALRVTPGARGNAVDGVEADSGGRFWLRVKVSAPPADGEANKAVVKFLSKRWRLPKSSFAIVSGSTSRNKILSVSGDVDTIQTAIETDL